MSPEGSLPKISYAPVDGKNLLFMSGIKLLILSFSSIPVVALYVFLLVVCMQVFLCKSHNLTDPSHDDEAMRFFAVSTMQVTPCSSCPLRLVIFPVRRSIILMHPRRNDAVAMRPSESGIRQLMPPWGKVTVLTQ